MAALEVVGGMKYTGSGRGVILDEPFPLIILGRPFSLLSLVLKNAIG